MFRRKPPQLTTYEELQETYNDCVNLTIKNITLEEKDCLEDSLKGWKSLHTSLLYKLELFEKSLHKMSNDEMNLFYELKAIRDENIKHLVRLQVKVDLVIKVKPVVKLTPSNMSVPSLRNGARNFNQPKKKMIKSLRPSGPLKNTSSHDPHQANLAANVSWQKPKLDLFDDFDQDLEIKNWEKISNGDDDEYDNNEENEPDLIDLDQGLTNLDSLSLKPNKLNSSSQPELYERRSTSQLLDTNQLTPQRRKESNSLNTSPNNTLLNPLKVSPNNTLLHPPKVSNSLENLSNNSTQDRKYIYKQPQPLNIHKLMKQTKSSAKPTTTHKSPSKTAASTSKLQTKGKTKTTPKSTITYNYVNKPSTKKKEVSVTPEPKSEESDEETFIDPLLNPKIQDEIIRLVRGIDYDSAKQILNDVLVHGDEVYWDDIVGLDDAKSSLKEAVVYPFLRPDLFKGLREPIRGMLLFGPPGTGKTMLARAVATESKSTFFSITSSTITSKYLGESEKLVKAMFLLAKKLSPSIVFIDEIDSLLGSRTEGEIESIRRIKNEFLIQWSELSSSTAKDKIKELDNQVLILGATNLPWSIDEAARRRFAKKQYIPLPEPNIRKNQIEKLLKYQKHELSDNEYKEIIELTDKFSGSDITTLCKDSAMGPLRSLGELLLSTPTEEIRPIKIEDFKNSLRYIKPSVLEDSLKKYQEWSIKFGSGI